MTGDHWERFDKAFREEVRNGYQSHGRIESYHDGIGRLLEEVDELRRAVAAARDDGPGDVMHEAPQVAALAARMFVYASSNGGDA